MKQPTPRNTNERRPLDDALQDAWMEAACWIFAEPTVLIGSTKGTQASQDLLAATQEAIRETLGVKP